MSCKSMLSSNVHCTVPPQCPTSSFHNPSFNSFEFWENDFQRFCAYPVKFSVCKYPFFINLATKKALLELENKRQMLARAEDALWGAITGVDESDIYLTIEV